MRNPFTAHPNDIGETYWRHAYFALRFGARMTLGGLAALVHAIFPFLFRTTASEIVDELSAYLAAARRKDPK